MEHNNSYWYKPKFVNVPNCPQQDHLVADDGERHYTLILMRAGSHLSHWQRQKQNLGFTGGLLFSSKWTTIFILFCFSTQENPNDTSRTKYFSFFSEYFSNEESRITFIYSKHLVKKDRHRLWKSTSVSEKWIFISDYFSKPKETASQCRQVVKENLFTQDWGQINIIQLTKIWCLPHLESRWDTL